MICVYRQQNVTSFSGNGLDGAVDPLDTPIFIKIISFSRPVSNGTSWMLRSQPEPQDSKIYETDIHQAVFMTVNRCYQGNKAHLFDIHYSIFSTTEEDVTSPPKCPFIFVPVPQLEAFTMKYKSYKENYSICNGIWIYCVSSLTCAIYSGCCKSESIWPGTLSSTATL